MKTFVFPGQGSQKKGMGHDLFDKFQGMTATADEILGYSTKELCLEDPHGRLSHTEYTQPALYLINALSWLDKMRDETEPPDFLAGHSLGEYNALFAAGAFDFETGLLMVQERGRLMAQAKGGGMAAVIGMDSVKIREILDEGPLKNISIANYNSPGQWVISGIKEEIIQAGPFFKKAGGKFIPLKVSGAFHSPYMAEAALEFSAFLEKFTCANPSVPVISNVSARPYETGDVKKMLIAQMTSPVMWIETVEYLMGRGVREFHEIGPGKVLTGLVRRIKGQ